MLSLIQPDFMRESWPNFIYQRINMTAAKNYFFHSLETGYYYFLKEVRSKWAEIDAAGLVFAPQISIEMVGSAVARVHQNTAIPLDIISTPGSRGVQISATGDMTSISPTLCKSLNEMRLFQDNITLILSGQNATPFPAYVDIVVCGYMIPRN